MDMLHFIQLDVIIMINVGIIYLFIFILTHYLFDSVQDCILAVFGAVNLTVNKL